MSVELDRECKNCGMKLKQHVSFNEENGRVTIKVCRYKCPFCNAVIRKPKAEEIVSGRRKKRPHAHAHEIVVRADKCVMKYRTEIKEPKVSKVKRFSKAMSRVLYNSLFGFVFRFFKFVNQKTRFKISLWYMRRETLEHVSLLIKVFKWIVLPASLLYVFADFYFFGENVLDSMFLGILIFFYSNFLPDLPSIYYRKKKFGRRTEDLLWDEKCVLLLLAPLFIGAFLCGIRLRWHTLETFHNFKSLTIYAAFLFLLGFLAFGNITEILSIFAYGNMTKLPISIGEVTEIFSLPLYGVIGYLTHLKVDHYF